MSEEKPTYDWETKLSRDVEQAEAGTKTIASLTVLYYRELVEAKIPEKTAAYLTAAWLSAQFGQKSSHA